MLGIFGGSLAGVFILGVFFTRPNALGASIGFFTGVVVVLLVKNLTNVHPYLYGAISVLTCVTAGYLTSLLSPVSKGLQGLTYPTLVKKAEAENAESR